MVLTLFSVEYLVKCKTILRLAAKKEEKMKNSLSIAISIVMSLSSVQSFANEIQIIPFFNTPGFGINATSTVEDRMVEAIQTAVPGSSIRVSMYIMSQPHVSQQLVLAAERGVDVQLVLDGRNIKNLVQGDAIDILIRGFDGHPGIDNCSQRPCVKFCHGPLEFLNIHHGTIGGSCHGLAINHNKFMIFSELSSGEKHVVMQSSANVEEAHLHRYNDLLEVQNDRRLFDGYMNYWNGLKRDRTRLTSPGDFSGDSGIVVRTSPRLIGKDPVKKLLKRVSCHLPNSTVFAAQSDLGRASIAKQLARLRREGCRIEVLALHNPHLNQPGRRVREALNSALVLTPSESETQNSIHTKMMLIDAAFDGANVKTKMVITGSQNLDLWSLKTNDECQMEIANDQVYDQYLTFWNQILSDASEAGLSVFPVTIPEGAEDTDDDGPENLLPPDLNTGGSL